MADVGDSASILARLETTARSRGFPADPSTLECLVRFLDVVIEESRRVNLTAAKDLDRAVDVLALSALAVSRTVADAATPRLVVDLGTGNGLPGVAAALAWPASRVLLVERRGRKAAAVARCVERTGIGNAEVVACDGRELLREHPEVEAAVDLVTVRAVGPLADAVRITHRWLAPGGRIAHWKGRSLDEAEIRAGEAAAVGAGLRVLPALSFEDAAGPGRLLLYERPARA